VSTKGAGDFSRHQLRRIFLLTGTAWVTALLLAILGFWWWPLSLAAIPLLVVVNREADPRGLLDPIPHKKGHRGEVAMADCLSELPARYRVHHGIDIGRGNVDHVVIGPTGIFAIETKNWQGHLAIQHGQLTNDGYDAETLVTQALAEAMAIRDRLRAAGMADQWVEAVAASVQGNVEGGQIQTRNVTVLPAASVVPFMLHRRMRLSAREIERAEAAIMRRPAMSRSEH
jgi:Nuclease-related domain